MAKIKLEYIWLDGYQPDPSIRCKTKIVDIDDFDGELEKVPMWNFDGSSTEQAEGHSSDCLLKPVATYFDAGRKDAWLVMAEVLNADGTAHPTNYRATINDDDDTFWFGFEQEYTISQDGLPLGFPRNGYPAPQGPYYCSVGTGANIGREIVEEHLDLCLAAGIGITGVNAEVMLGQWEYQCFGKGPQKAADDLWVSRYLLHRIGEKYEVTIDLEPKPVKGDWNGSGMHANFSNAQMREEGGEDYLTAICEAFRPTHDEHIAVYGTNNHERLTGLHETQSINTFSFGVSDRGASIRIPVGTVDDGWKGYLEDRRPASNADPYKVSARIVKTVKSAELVVA